MTEEQFAEIEIMMRPIMNQLANMVARAVVSRTTDGGNMQTLQLSVLETETIDGAERFQQYGLSSVPLAGAEAVVIFPGGDHAHPLVIAVDDRRHRPTGLKDGEVALYNDAAVKILLTEDGDCEITVAAGRKLFVRTDGGSTVAVATKDDVDSIYDAIKAGTPVPNDGGAALQTAALASMNVDRPYGAATLEAE